MQMSSDEPGSPAPHGEDEHGSSKALSDENGRARSPGRKRAQATDDTAQVQPLASESCMLHDHELCSKVGLVHASTAMHRQGSSVSCLTRCAKAQYILGGVCDTAHAGT